MSAHSADTDRAKARRRISDVIKRLAPLAPKVTDCSRAPREDLLAFYASRPPHWSKLRSTNPLERVNHEIGRRADIAAIFPNDASALRLTGAMLIEQNDDGSSVAATYPTSPCA